MSDSDRRSTQRRQLQQLYLRLGTLLDSMEARHSTFAGVVYRLRTRCGKPRCVCREGQLHSAWCASFLQQGRRRLRTLPDALRDKLLPMAERYRALRRLRAELNRTFAQLVRTFDALERSLRIPPSQALRSTSQTRRS